MSVILRMLLTVQSLGAAEGVVGRSFGFRSMWESLQTVHNMRRHPDIPQTGLYRLQ